MALCHHELLVSKVGHGQGSPNDNLVQGQGQEQLPRIKSTLQFEGSCIADIMKELLQLKLTRYLPITA